MTRRVVLGGLLTAALSAAALCAPASAQVPKTAEGILDRFAKVSGGAIYAKLKTLRMTMELNVGAQGIKGTAVSTYKMPNKVHLVQEMPGLATIIQSYDGTTAWSKDPFLGLRTLEGLESAQLVDQVASNDPTKWQKFYKSVTLGKPTKVDGKPAQTIKVVSKGGSTQTMFFDDKTGFLVRLDMVAESPQGKIPTQSFMKDYRRSELGISLPSLTRIVAGGQVVEMKLLKVEGNIAVDDALFAKPKPDPEKTDKM